jgi:hypothetical protein
VKILDDLIGSLAADVPAREVRVGRFPFVPALSWRHQTDSN